MGHNLSTFCDTCHGHPPNCFQKATTRNFFDVLIKGHQSYRILRIIPVTLVITGSIWYHPTISTLARRFAAHRLPSSQPLAYIIAPQRLSCFFSTKISFPLCEHRINKNIARAHLHLRETEKQADLWWYSKSVISKSRPFKWCIICGFIWNFYSLYMFKGLRFEIG